MNVFLLAPNSVRSFFVRSLWVFNCSTLFANPHSGQEGYKSCCDRQWLQLQCGYRVSSYEHLSLFAS
ncbi:hypothetical protein IQ268_28265 [Oculatella sp. LEGE 06141]|uniref:hypothetical protein n=1 Tax=Oculatella sp. LEGE 06141 TaxID=1828648 RepID=UPI001881F102|nr:hypothetical protein [Oculatella sp. LEGE 06141]MBE9182448.1 hypothetical protein [Oculatella sp. LEGE 06141]